MASLRIHEWYNEYHVPAGHPAPRSLGNDLDRLVPRLAEALADGIGTMLASDNDDGVVLLPSLTIACTVDTACEPDRIVPHWARQLTLAFARALDDPAGCCVRFPSRAAYHARFITELAHGRGWDSWLYRRFDGLRVLPASAAIRTLLTDDVDLGRQTLALIGEQTWPALFATLSPREAVRIVLHWHEHAAGRAPASLTHPMLAALVAWAGSARDAPVGLPPALLALWLLAQWQREPAAGAQPPIGAACWLATLLSLPAHLPQGELRRIARGADLGVIRDAGLASDADWLLLLASAPATQRKAAPALAEAILQAAGKAPDAASAASPSSAPLSAPFAGLAWLLPALQDLLSPAVAATLPPVRGDCVASDIAALLTLAIASGRQGERVWRDPFWRGFFRLPPDFETTALAEWLGACDPAPIREMLGVSLRYRARTAPVALRFRLEGATVEQSVERASACRMEGEPTADDSAAPLPFAERLTLTRLLRQDAQWLAASPTLAALAALPAGWRELFETLAQATLRRTAYRIPGAARCSLPYLFANVLNVRGQAKCGGTPPEQSWTLELGRPPLYVLLSLNGMARLRLPWPGARSLALHCVE